MKKFSCIQNFYRSTPFKEVLQNQLLYYP